MVLTCARSCIVAPSKLTSIINEDRPWAWNSEYFEINIFISNDMLSTSLLKIPTENTLQKSAIKNIHCTGQIMFLLNLWKLNCDKQSLYLCAVLFASKSNKTKQAANVNVEWYGKALVHRISQAKDRLFNFSRIFWITCN